MVKQLKLNIPSPDGHFKIPHPWWWPLEDPHRGKEKMFSDRASIIYCFFFPKASFSEASLSL